MKSLSDRISALSPEQRTLFEQKLKSKSLDLYKQPVMREGIAPRGHKHSSPLSYDQERMFFQHQMSPDKHTFNLYCVSRITGLVPADQMERSINTSIERHEAWRTVFDIVDGQPRQIVLPSLQVKINRVRLGHLPLEEREAEARRLIKEEVHKPFDLSRGPLVRFNMYFIHEEEALFNIVLHHLINDRITYRLFFQEFIHYTQGYLKGHSVNLPEPELQYADYAEWQRKHWVGEAREKTLGYWKEQLAGSDFVLNLSTDFPRPPVHTFRGARVFFDVPKELTERLTAIAVREGSTIFIIMLAAYKAFLYRYTGDQDVLVGSPIANRMRTEVERTFGSFLSTCVYRTQVSGDLTFLELLQRVRRTSMDVLNHQEAPFSLLLEEIKPEPDTSRYPLVQSVFVYVDGQDKPLQVPETQTDLQTFDGETAKYDHTLILTERDGGFAGVMEFCPDLFEEATFARMTEHFLNLLERIAENPQQNIDGISLFSEEEERTILQEWNDTHAPFSDASGIHSLFEAQAERTPDAIAVGTLSYAQLNARANQLAHALEKSGLCAGNWAGLQAGDPVDRIVGLLGVLKAGAVCVLGEGSLAGAIHMKVTESLLQASAGESEANPVTACRPDQTAYVVHTSGTTGDPQLVMIKHRAICNAAEDLIQRLDIKPGSRVLQAGALSPLEIFVALLSGARVVTAGCGDDLPAVIRDQEVTDLILTPTLLAALPPQELPSVRTVVSAGECCTVDWEAWRQDGRRLFIAYGTTETAHVSTLQECSDGQTSSRIGKPIANTEIRIVDRDGQPVPLGVRGEILIGGAACGTRWHHTGDAGRYLPDGTIEFLGRMDREAKLGSYRVQPEAVAQAIALHPFVQQAEVTVWEDEAKKRHLIAHVVVREGAACSEMDLHQHLRERFPHYMIPSAYVMLDRMPALPNGKANLRLLVVPAEVAHKVERSYVPPENSLEMGLVKLWEDVLRVPRIGVDTHFVDLGGDSLKMMVLNQKIYNDLQVDMPFRILYQYPTIKQLTNAILLHVATADNVLSFNRRRGNADVFSFQPLAVFHKFYDSLTGELPRHAIHLFDYVRDEDRIAQYVKQIQKIQKQGPYVLMGYSGGGILAFEVAKELEARGETVSDLILLDTKREISHEEVAGVQDLVRQYVDDFMNGMYGDSFQDVSEQTMETFGSYFKFVADAYTPGTAHTQGMVLADIHVLTASATKEEEVSSWQSSTTGRLFVRQGFGQHEEMLEVEAYEKQNAGIIGEILSGVKRQGGLNDGAQ